jgi:hypothetical protein
MKKLLLLLTVIGMITSIKAQWVTRNIDNGLDDPYKIAYCTSSSEGGVLKMEQFNGGVSVYIRGTYYCDNSLLVDFGFVVNKELKRYTMRAYKSENSKSVFFMDNIFDEENAEFLSDFQNCTKLRVRVNETHCSTEYYEFDMTGSSKALNFMK